MVYSFKRTIFGHRNGPKSEFGSFFFQELSEIPQKLESVEGFPNILGRFPL